MSNITPISATIDTPWLNCKQAAEYLGIDETELRRLSKAGRIAYSAPSPRRHRWHLDHLDAYLNAAVRPARSTVKAA